MAKQRKNFSQAERTKRAEQMRRLNESGRAGAIYGHLGGRPRKGESAAEALERRKKEFLEAGQLVKKPEPPVIHVPAQQDEAESDEQRQVRRAFNKGKPPSAWRIQGNPGRWYL